MIHKLNSGIASARNEGIELAKGDFIAFLDCDDIWIEDKIKMQVEILLKIPDFGLVHSPCQIINSEGEVLSKIIGESFSWRNKHGDVSLKIFGSFTLMKPTPLIRREIISKVGLFDESMTQAGEDTEFWTRSLL